MTMNNNASCDVHGDQLRLDRPLPAKSVGMLGVGRGIGQNLMPAGVGFVEVVALQQLYG